MTSWEEINPWNEGMHALSASPEKGESGGNRARSGVTGYPRTGWLSRGRVAGHALARTLRRWRLRLGSSSPSLSRPGVSPPPFSPKQGPGGPDHGRAGETSEAVLGDVERLFDPADGSVLLIFHSALGLRYCRCNGEHQATIGIKFVRGLSAEHCHRCA